MPELPPPLPAGERTVGQLVAETIRGYGAHFWPALPLGLPLALADQASVRQTAVVQMLVFWAATPLFAAAYVRACSLLHGHRPTATSFALAVLIWLPFPALRAAYILPGVAWLAIVGLAVPAAIVERLGFRSALARGRQLGLADFVHALGSLAALVIVVGVASNTLAALLHTQGDSDQRIAGFLSDLVISPLLYLGGALLYLDQVARVGFRRPRKRSRNARLHADVDADPAGHPEPQVES